ncbi:hypothetical protein RI543_003898 [Arxiozyma heterogenica]|uniref:Uncharacterized protein n=1 Tax=Arxiozyma heterogenica TaxID=278026 RepID=A0AAN7WH78_9SACH|nr:hypothetical protein RI543_003898 [Kazachstania heterogenica]
MANYNITIQNDELNDSKLYLLDHSFNILQSKPLNNGDVEFNRLLKSCQQKVKVKIDELNYDENDTDHSQNNYILLDDYNGEDSENIFVPIKNINKLNKEWNKFIANFYTLRYHRYQINQLIHRLAKQSSINLDSTLNLNYSTRKSIIEQTQFSKILYHQIQVIPIVNWLNKWLPPIFITTISLSYYDNKLKWKILNKFISDDTLYQIFGWFNLDAYLEENDLSTGSIFNNSHNNDHNSVGGIDNERVSISTNHRFSINSNISALSTITKNNNDNDINILNMNDIEYSLQDGKYLFERAMSKSNTNRYTDNINFNNSNIFSNENEPTKVIKNDTHHSSMSKLSNYLDNI